MDSRFRGNDGRGKRYAPDGFLLSGEWWGGKGSAGRPAVDSRFGGNDGGAKGPPGAIRWTPALAGITVGWGQGIRPAAAPWPPAFAGMAVEIKDTPGYPKL